MSAPFRQRATGYVRSRGRLLALAASLGAAVAWANTMAPPHDRAGLVQCIEEKSHLTVDSLAFGPSAGPVLDWLFGRNLLLSGRRGGERADLYSLRVRLLPDGTPLGLHSLHNVTETPLSDERGISAKGPFALYATVGPDGIDSFTLFRFRPVQLSKGPLTVLRESLTNALSLGTIAPVDSVSVLFPHPLPGLHVEPVERSLKAPLRLRVEAGPESFTFTEAELFPASEAPLLDERAAFTLVRRGHDTTPPLPFLVDLLRDFTGPGPIASLENAFFGAQDRMKRLMAGPKPRPAKKSPEKSRDAEDWPPNDVLPLFADPPRGEGKWTPLGADESEPGRPSPLLTTTLRADPERPYSEVRLVAIDTSRLELGLRAGYEEPHPASGPKGSGMLPPALHPRVVATFNGGFQSVHGAYGMHAEGRLLMPPQRGAATVLIEANGRVGLGTFTGGTELKGADFRQNLEALLENGRINPNGRADWGDHVIGGTVAAERSALGVTQQGHLLYAWSGEATAETLARALDRAGATYALHLDMNPGHTGFAQHEGLGGARARSSLLDSRMRGNPERYLKWSAQDFFYLTRRSALPDRSTFEFHPQEEEKIPRVAVGERTLAHVRIVALRFAPDRVGLALLPGEFDSRVPGTKTERPRESPGKMLFALSCGHATQGARSGLFLEGSPVIPWKEHLATLVLSPAGARLLPPGTRPTDDARTWLQLPSLVENGEATAFASQLGERRSYSALCEEPNGHFLVVSAENDSPLLLASAMIDEGCTTAALLDRGSHEEASVLTNVEPTTLAPAASWLVARETKGVGRAYHFPATSPDGRPASP